MITNKTLMKNLEIILNKKIDNVQPVDIVNIVGISCSNDGGKDDAALLELSNFSSLSHVTIYNSLIEQKDINLLSSLSYLCSISFVGCYFKGDIVLKNSKLESLTFERCMIRDYSFLSGMTNLKQLGIIFPYADNPLSMKHLMKLKKMTDLCLEGCYIIDCEGLFELPELVSLSLMFSECNNLNFISKFPNLQKLYLLPECLEKYNFDSCKFKIFTSKINMVIDDENNTRKLV